MADNEDLLSSLLKGNSEPEENPESTIQPLTAQDLEAPIEEAPADESAWAAPTEEPAASVESPIENQLADEVEATQVSMGDQLLAGAVESTALSGSNEPPQFSVVLRNFFAQREGLAKLLAALDLKAPRAEDLDAGEALLMSRLDEYRAIMLSQGAWDLGLAPEFRATSSMENLDITNDAIVDGAPSVEFIQGSQTVWIGTVQNVPGTSVLQSFGLVSCHRSIPRRFFRQIEAEQSLLADLERLKLPQTIAENHYEELLQDLTRELQVATLGRGANAVVGVELEFFPELHGADADSDELRVVLSGTAVKLTQAVDLPLNSL